MLLKPILLLGEAPGEQEAKIGSSFVGASGVLLLNLLHDSGVIHLTSDDRGLLSKYWTTQDPNCTEAVWQMHTEVHRINVFAQHPPKNDLSWFCGPKEEALPGYPPLIKKKPEYRYWRGGYLRKEFAHELDRLGDEILRYDPNLIVAMGNTPLWALCGRSGITKLRGTTCVSTHTVSGYKLLCTYHPAAVLRQYELRPTTVADFSKINREKEFPDVRRPRCEIWIEPAIEDIERFIEEHIKGCALLSVDIETSGNQVTCIGFAPRKDLALVIPIHDSRNKSGSYWTTAEEELRCWALIRSILENRMIPKLLQNGLYDSAFLWRSYGIRIMGMREDSMLCHHALQPEALKGLAYLGSVYTDHGPWKSERTKNETIKRDA